MVDSISNINEAIEKGNFSLAQTLIEQNLFDKNIKTPELYESYFNVLSNLSRPIKSKDILEFVELIASQNPLLGNNWLEKIDDERIIKSQRYVLVQIIIAEKLGQLEKAYHLVNEYNLKSIIRKNPVVPEKITEVITKFFNDDFNLKRQVLALSLLRSDYTQAEKIIKELILSCFERSVIKGRSKKLESIQEIVKLDEEKQVLRIYSDLIRFLTNELTPNELMKRFIECVIYFDDFKFQVLMLSVFDLNLESLAVDYSRYVKGHNDFDFVYLDKYFPMLKKYFVKQVELKKTSVEKEEYEIDLSMLEESPASILDSFQESPDSAEAFFVSQLKSNNFSFMTLLDFAVGLIQSDCLYAATEALEQALEKCSNDEELLKIKYLLVTSLLKKQDYRLALDVILETLPKCKTQNDVLSFLYAESEAYIRLNELKNAKKILEKIVGLDSSYRMAKERLDKLNAV